MKRFKEEMGNFLKKIAVISVGLIAVTIIIIALLTGIVRWAKWIKDYIFCRKLTGTRYDEEDKEQKIRYLRGRDEPIDEEKVVRRVHPVRGSGGHEESTETDEVHVQGWR